MENKTVFRLYFIDVIRAFAICMMLQGHFVDGLLANTYRDTSNIFFNTWLYFRGITAPVFFTVSGFIFMFLLTKERDQNKTGWQHIRVQKGIKRGFVLILTAYLLRLNFHGLLFNGEIYNNTYMIDVLHCIGLSLLFLISIYLFSYQKKSWLMPSILLAFPLVLFTIYPIYSKLTFDYLPMPLANYFTKANGSVFTIFPWFGYASFGAFMGTLFSRFRDYKHIYRVAIGVCLTFGTILVFGSSWIFNQAYQLTNNIFFINLGKNTIYERLGNVLLIFAFFMIFRNIIMNKTIRTIGQNTLSIYIIHYIILYGSFIGIGLYRYFHHRLSPYVVIPGALAFVILNLWLSFQYNKNKPFLDEKFDWAKSKIILFTKESQQTAKILFVKVKNLIAKILVGSRPN